MKRSTWSRERISGQGLIRQEVAVGMFGELASSGLKDGSARRLAARSFARIAAHRVSAVSGGRVGQNGSLCAKEEVLCGRLAGFEIGIRRLGTGCVNANTWLNQRQVVTLAASSGTGIALRISSKAYLACYVSTCIV